MTKTYLDEDGVRVLVRNFNSNLDLKADKTDLENLATKADLQNVSVDLSDYATEDYVKNQIANIEQPKPYDDSDIVSALESLEAKTSGLYHYKGSVDNLAALTEIENPEVGDTYNLRDTGMNAAWTGTEWDQFGSVTDLSEYIKSEEIQAIAIPELIKILYGGKSAAVNDTDGLKAMLNNDQSEVKITLDENLNLEEVLIVPEGKKVELNLNGKKIESTGQVGLQILGDVALSNGAVEATGAAIQVVNGKLTLDNVDVTSTSQNGVNASGANAELIVNSGNITAQEYGVCAIKGSTVTINGGHLTGLDNFGLGGNGSVGSGGCNVTINGGIIEGQIQSAGYVATAIYWPNSGVLTVNGGTIKGGTGIVQRGGTVILNEGTTIIADGPANTLGKAGDSKVTVGPYAVVYDQSAGYPDAANMQLNIAENVVLQGTDGDLSILPETATGIIDNR